MTVPNTPKSPGSGPAPTYLLSYRATIPSIRLFRMHIVLLTTTLLLLSASPAFPWTGECVGITDGDTIKVLHDRQSEKIRLHGIDCPEKRQLFGKRARQFTRDLVFRRMVRVDPLGTDRYGRTIAVVSVNGTNVNHELVRAGMVVVSQIRSA